MLRLYPLKRSPDGDNPIRLRRQWCVQGDSTEVLSVIDKCAFCVVGVCVVCRRCERTMHSCDLFCNSTKMVDLRLYAILINVMVGSKHIVFIHVYDLTVMIYMLYQRIMIVILSHYFLCIKNHDHNDQYILEKKLGYLSVLFQCLFFIPQSFYVYKLTKWAKLYTICTL